MSLIALIIFITAELIFGRDVSSDAHLILAGLLALTLVIDHGLYSIKRSMIKPWEVLNGYLNEETKHDEK